MMKKLTLLFVDDDVRELAHNKDKMEMHGYRVLTATNGPDAMQLIADEKIDGVVLDYQMSPQNGEAVAMDIWRRYVDVPIILFSTNPYDIPVRLMAAVDVFADKGHPLEELLVKLKVLFRGDARPA
jgi:DNA-binding response OmpR family regulator